MKTTMKTLARDEKGAALLLAIILLLVGGLIAAPLLAHMGTGILTGEVYETRTAELYAADAGVEDAVWKIQHQVDVPTGCSNDTTRSYNITDVNGRKVTYDITRANNVTLTYRVVSTATADGSGTQIEAYVTGNVTYCNLMDHLITVQDDLTPQEVKKLGDQIAKLDIPCPTGCTECAVCGKAYDYDSDAYKNMPQECKGCIAVYNFPSAGWPKVNNISDRYWEDVATLNASSQSSITLDGNSIVLGPLKRLGTLTISGTGTVTLNGTLYITDDTKINGKNDNDPILLRLNGNTVFVNSTTPQALEITQCTLEGPGVIIAVGDIKFWPKLTGGMDAPIFVLSVLGTTDVQPSGDIYGAIAGKVNVEIASGSAPSATYPEGGFGNLTLPYSVEFERTYSIASWEVTPL